MGAIKFIGGGGGGAVNQVTGSNGVTASPTTGNVVVSGIDATTSTLGVASFDPTFFTVTSGNVSFSGTTIATTITGNSGGPISPSSNNWNIKTNNSTAAFVGSGSTLTLDFGLSNLCLGSSLPSLTSGTQNVSVGDIDFLALTSGSDNVAVGYACLDSLTTGSSNSSVGFNSLALITTGSNNSALGSGALPGGNGSYNIAVGANAGTNYASTESSNIVIGNPGTAADSNVIRIGDSNNAHSSYQTKCYIAGIDGVNVGSVAKVVTEASDQLGTATITGSSTVTVTPTANTITLAAGTSVATTFNADSGSATPSSNAITFAGGPGITTSATGSTVTINSVVFSDPNTNVTLAANTGVFAKAAITLTLPGSVAQGTVVEVVNALANTIVIQAASSQLIRVGSAVSSATGTATSVTQGDTLILRYRTANTTWYATSVIGTWSLA